MSARALDANTMGRTLFAPIGIVRLKLNDDGDEVNSCTYAPQLGSFSVSHVCLNDQRTSIVANYISHTERTCGAHTIIFPAEVGQGRSATVGVSNLPINPRGTYRDGAQRARLFVNIRLACSFFAWFN